jgi:hypothetical protein
MCWGKRALAVILMTDYSGASDEDGELYGIGEFQTTILGVTGMWLMFLAQIISKQPQAAAHLL